MNHQDILSEVFSTLRINSNLYFRAQFCGAYSVEVPQERRCIRFHLVREGQCYLEVPGTEPVVIKKGDIAIVPDGALQILSANTDLKPVPLADVLEQGALEKGLLNYGQGSCQASLLCGFCTFDEAIDHPILTALPKLIILSPRELEKEPWAIATLELLAMEAELEAPGMTGILSRLLEIAFMQAVRRITHNQISSQGGFIAALTHAKLSKALHVIHNEPQVAWTIEGLAKQAGMSRARFADKFVKTVGVPPIGYLTKWRLMKGRSLLSGTNLDMEEIANRCGYASATSFSRRFKEEFDIGPGAYRKIR